MRRFSIALSTLVVLASAPSFAHTKAATTYHLVYGTKDVGTWNLLTVGRQKSGTYDGSTFDSTNGPGFPTVTLTRRSNAADLSGLFSSLSAVRGRLTVTTYTGAKATAVTTCPKAVLDSFGVPGNPRTTPETIVFACTSVSATRSR